MLYIDLTTIVAVIMGLAELIKRVTGSQKFVPIFNIIFGVAFGIVYLEGTDIAQKGFMGLIAGLTASGVYSSGKNVKEGIKNE